MSWKDMPRSPCQKPRIPDSEEIPVFGGVASLQRRSKLRNRLADLPTPLLRRSASLKSRRSTHLRDKTTSGCKRDAGSGNSRVLIPYIASRQGVMKSSFRLLLHARFRTCWLGVPIISKCPSVPSCQALACLRRGIMHNPANKSSDIVTPFWTTTYGTASHILPNANMPPAFVKAQVAEEAGSSRSWCRSTTFTAWMHENGWKPAVPRALFDDLTRR